MATKAPRTSIPETAKKTRAPAAPPDAAAVLAWLERRGTAKERAALARYAIPADHAFGISVGDLRRYAKELGRSHTLAVELWKSGWYEARMLAAFVGEPERLTPTLMNRWQKDFDSWAIVDTVCFALFDRTPHAWAVVPAWSRARGEFQRRAAFALLWALAAHDKGAADGAFREHLPLLEAAATDERNFVKKAVDMALRAIGKRRPGLRGEVLELAARLQASDSSSAAWIGRGVAKELGGPAAPKRTKSARSGRAESAGARSRSARSSS